MNNPTSYSKVKKGLEESSFTCVDLVKNYIKKIKKTQHLNLFIEIYEEESLARAKEVDKKIDKKIAGKLAGMILGIKDNICYKNHIVTAGSKILEGFKSLYNSTAVERILSEDGIIIGRLNCDEFAMGSTNKNSVYGPAKNPINEKKVTGGSSGGSAGAVAAGLCLASLGTDTGGSIRQPASFCGVVGLKPTYARVSRNGLIAYASSFDQIGTLTNNIEDAGVILEVISGADDYDNTVSRRRVPKFSQIHKIKTRKKIAYILEYLDAKGLDKEIKETINKQLKKLQNLGHIVRPVSFQYLDYLVPTYYVITTAEASSNLSRFDGVRFGYRSKKPTDLEKTYIKTRTEGFGKEVKRRIMLGNFVLKSGYNDAYFSKAQKIRRLIQQKTNEIFKEFDFILTPTTPHTAFDIEKPETNPIEMYLEDIYTVHANLSGIPAISLPLGLHSNNMPFGIQLMAPSFKEAELLAFSSEMLS